MTDTSVTDNAKDTKEDNVITNSDSSNDNTKYSTTENGTDSSSADDVKVIKNIATSSLNDNPQDTNEVKNNLKPETPEEKKNEDTPSNGESTPNNSSNPDTAVAKMAQTGSKRTILTMIFDSFKNFKL